MLMRRRNRTAGRHVLVALALLALAFRLLVPSGFMPGSSLAEPIVPCAGQGSMPGMTMPMATEPAMAGDRTPDDRHGPTKASARRGSDEAPHGGTDRSCAFAGMGVAPFVADPGLPLPMPVSSGAPRLAASIPDAMPGRGMAAPPPPSHAPPAFRA